MDRRKPTASKTTGDIVTIVQTKMDCYKNSREKDGNCDCYNMKNEKYLILNKICKEKKGSILGKHVWSCSEDR